MVVDIQPASHPVGTTIEVNNLFFNTPARRKFLRTDKTEFQHIDEVVRRIALAKPHVSFTLSHNGKIVRQYRKTVDNSLEQLFGLAARGFTSARLDWLTWTGSTAKRSLL